MMRNMEVYANQEEYLSEHDANHLNAIDGYFNGMVAAWDSGDLEKVRNFYNLWIRHKKDLSRTFVESQEQQRMAVAKC